MTPVLSSSHQVPRTRGRARARALAVAGLTAMTVVVVPTGAASALTCDAPLFRTVASKGQSVWVPGSVKAGAFQFGGSQSITRSRGSIDTSVKGSADTVGGSASVGFSLAEVSATYNRTWNRSTSRALSFSRTYTTNSGSVPRSVNWRWRLYQRGYLFTAVRKEYRRVEPGACRTEYVRQRKLRVVVPERGTDNYSFQVERYASRNRLHGLDGKAL